MRLGYSAWGFLGDIKVENGGYVSTPDGNATYTWSILWEAQRRGWETFWMQRDRDREGWELRGSDIFRAFSGDRRLRSYLNTRQTGGEGFPELDVIIVEWRFPIPGRNCVYVPAGPEVQYDRYLTHASWNPSVCLPGIQPDLFRQREILNHYLGTRTRVILWDLDHKLEVEDEAAYVRTCDAIFETSFWPREILHRRVAVEPPTCVDQLGSDYPLLRPCPQKKLAYIGSRYERDDVITEWLGPVSSRYPGEVMFYGNWLKSVDECRRLWPDVSYNDRVTVEDFRLVYGDAVAVPLLAKRSYLERGFVTPRVFEALAFGTLPVGLDAHSGIERYVPQECIAESGEHMIEVVERLSRMSYGERVALWGKNVDMIGHMDVSHFVDEVERVASA